jgi:hypothetical protein
MDRAGVNSLKKSQYFGMRTCGDEKTAGRTIGFNQLRMTWIDSEDRERWALSRHGNQSKWGVDADWSVASTAQVWHTETKSALATRPACIASVEDESFKNSKRKGQLTGLLHRVP